MNVVILVILTHRYGRFSTLHVFKWQRREVLFVTEHTRATNNTVLVWVINKLKPYKISLASSKSYICKLDEDATGQREARDSHLFCFVSHSVHVVRETSPSQTQQSSRRAQEKMNDP